MLIKFIIWYCVHILINIYRNHLVNYIYQIFIDSNRILLVSMHLGLVIFSFIVYILTDYQIKMYAIRNLYIYNAVFISHWGTTFRGRPFWHQIHYKKHLILRYNFLSSQYTGKYLFCSFKYHLWRWRVLKNENIFISYNTDMNYNDIYSKTITALCCTNCQS